MPLPRRNTLIAGSVVLLHVLALWALQTGLLRRMVEVVVPVSVLSEFIAPPTPKVSPPPPVPTPPRPQPTPKTPSPPPPPQLAAVPDPTPAPAAPTGVVNPEPPAPILAPVAAAPTPAPPAPPAPPRIELPSSDADYLQNPKPAYPSLSKRLGEQGKVLVRVYISANGAVDKGEIKQSSGYDRLDQAALNAVLRWRFVPGKRAGVPEAMWHTIPINFVLE